MRPLNNNHWLRRAAQLYESGKLDQAEKLARQNFKAEPTAAANLMAGVALKRGDLEAAKKYLERALRESPDALAIRMNLISVARQSGDAATALRHLEVVAANAPRDAASQFDLGCLYLDLERVEDAIDAFRKCDAIRPFPATKARLAEALIRADRVKDAAPVALAAIAGGQESAFLHYVVGRNLLAASKPGLAAECFEKALSLDPDHEHSLIALSIAKSGRRDILGARSATRRVLELRPFVSVGPRDAPLRVATTHAMVSGYFSGDRPDHSVYRSGNYPSLLAYDDVRIDHYPVDLMRTDQEFDDHRADIVLNNIVNGDLLQSETAFRAARRAVEAFGAPVVNDPEAAARTTRQENYERFKDAESFVFPAIHTFRAIGADRSEISDQVIDKIGVPVILRPARTQLGGGAVLCRTAEDLREKLASWKYEDVSAIRYYDCRDERGNARQFRIAALAGELYPERVNVAPYWHSHGYDRAALGWYENGYDAYEKRFLEDPGSVIGADPARVFKPFLDRLGLEIFGIDFGLGAEGRIIIFEANASMNLFNPKSNAFCPYKVASVEAFQRRVREYLMQRAGKADG